MKKIVKTNFSTCFSGLYDNPNSNENPFPDVDIEGMVANQRLMQKFQDVSPKILKEKMEKSAKLNKSLNKNRPAQSSKQDSKLKTSAKDLSLADAWGSRSKYPLSNKFLVNKFSKMTTSKRLKTT